MRVVSRQSGTAAGVCLTIVLAGGVSGCKQDAKPADKDVNYDVPTPTPRAPAAKATPAKPGDPAPPPSPTVTSDYGEMPTPPPGARYTIYCQAYAGQDHQDVARHVRDLLRANTPYHKWYVIHDDHQSTLYYGFYRAVGRDKDDPAEGERALADLTAIRTLHDSRGSRLFSSSLPVPIDSPDPTANPAWDITRSGGYWSLEIGTFKDTPDRKERAVQAVADARAAGYPAYYYHGPRASSVCIGSWPREAVAEVSAEAQNTNPDQMVVATPAPLSPQFQQQLGQNVQTLHPQAESVDPSLIQMIAAFPAHSVNGAEMMKPGPDGRPTNVPVGRSFLFRIQDATAGDGGLAALPRSHGHPGPAGDPETVINAPAPPGGGLRGLGDN